MTSFGIFWPKVFKFIPFYRPFPELLCYPMSPLSLDYILVRWCSPTWRCDRKIKKKCIKWSSNFISPSKCIFTSKYSFTNKREKKRKKNKRVNWIKVEKRER